MDSRYRFLTLGIPWTQSMPSCDVKAATRLAEASWRRDNNTKRSPSQCRTSGMELLCLVMLVLNAVSAT